ncbi:MAG: polysaccharide pyruvyl transferase family protein [Burkholderiaceae bacterium]|nr:polysaccharide pyruvyl transferase family protein [Burkholderiaceae bacterium]
MKLHYFVDPEGNFGDDLNPWLWPRLLPRLLDDNAEELLVGIGTLINHRLPTSPIKHVVGSGVGYGQLPEDMRRFRFHAVRGFESAKALGLGKEHVITDAAVLIRTANLPPVAGSRSRTALMLTGRSLQNFDWERVCERAGVAFISCHWSVDRVLSEILRCDTLLTEAMHGAIVADALRVPWVPVTCSTQVLDFKWRDWLSSLHLAYEPSRVTPLFEANRRVSGIDRAKSAVKRGMRGLGIWQSQWSAPLPRDSSAIEIDQAVDQIRAATRRRPYLSDENLLQSHTRRYLELIERISAARTDSELAGR